MPEDIHNGSAGYFVRSLYFDTVFDNDLYDKIDGLANRRKIRLRIYPPDYNNVKLELKAKSGEFQRKRSVSLTRAEAEEIISGRLGVLMANGSALAREMYVIMNAEVYRPKCMVEYRRRAFVIDTNDIRVTFDANISANESVTGFFEVYPYLYPVTYTDSVTLEVKYNDFMFRYISDLLRDCGCVQVSSGKYYFARKIGHP
jgi:hypothetical protein